MTCKCLEALERVLGEWRDSLPKHHPQWRTAADLCLIVYNAQREASEPAAVPDPIKFARCERCSTSYPLQDAASHRCRPVGNGMFQIWHEPYVVPPEPADVPEARSDWNDGGTVTIGKNYLDRLRAWEAFGRAVLKLEHPND